jgi:hypothetical protein
MNNLEFNLEGLAYFFEDLQERMTGAGRDVICPARLARDQTFDNPAEIRSKNVISEDFAVAVR